MDLLHILETAVNAVIPIVLVIFLGFLLKTSGFLSKTFIKQGSALGFRVLLPCLLFMNVYKIEDITAIPWDLVIYCCCMLVILFLIGLATVNFTTSVPERKGVILQSVFRSNTAIIGISLASSLGGDAAVAVAAVVCAFSIPVLNILAVISLTIFLDRGDKISLKSILWNIVKNPLIDGIALGGLCLAIRSLQQKYLGSVVFSLSGDLRFLYLAINQLASIASPFALLVLGGQFSFSSSGSMLKEIIIGTGWRVFLTPLIAIGGAFLLSTYTGILHCGAAEYPSLIALFGTPVAVSSAIMAGQMHNDEQLATQLVVWTSITSIATMFVTVCILMSAGLLAV